MRLSIVIIALLAACGGSAYPSQRIVLSPAPPPGPWAVMRGTLDDCARSRGLAGMLEVRITLDGHGKVVAVDSAYGSGFASCVGNALLHTPYREYAQQTLAISFTPA